MDSERGKKSVAVLVHTCDGYNLLCQGFGIFFNRHWDYRIPTNNYIATEEIDIQIEGFTNVKSGTGAWSDRLSKVLREAVKEEYIIYIQEDMWLTKPVDYLFFEKILEFVISNSVDCVKLHSSEVYKTKETPLVFEGLKLTVLNNSESNYLMSHQITIWKKDFLLKQLPSDESPWLNEERATKRLKEANPTIYQIDYFSKNGKQGINHNINPYKRSEYYTISKNGLLSNNIKKFFEVLETSNSEVEQAYLKRLKYNYLNNITHDGKQKPYKENVRKIFRKWVKKHLLS